MSRFSRDLRRNVASRVCRHFDKFAEFTNPVEFDVMEAVYKPAYPDEDWTSMNTLLESKFGKECLSVSNDFELLMPGNEGRSKWSRTRDTFKFPDGKYRPSLEVEFSQLPTHSQEVITPWISKAIGYKKLRAELYNRVHALFDCQWDKYKSQDESGNWRGGPTPGTGCNTPGQVYRIWPEVVPLLPLEIRDEVRGANVRSRLPNHIHGYGGVNAFLALEPRDGVDDPTALKFEKRMFDAITHILVQMSLMTDVPHVKNYPEVSVV